MLTLGAPNATNVTGSSYSSGGTSPGTQSVTGSTMDMNAFLTMFTTQLRYQDPTNPLESYELAAQLAQFSTVEQLNRVNTNLELAQGYLSSLNNAQMINLIGKEVIGLNGTIRLAGGEASGAHYELTQPGTVTVRIYDEQDSLVRTIEVGAQEAGEYEMKWDGLNDAGEAAAEGGYRCEIEAVDGEGNTSAITPTIRGEVFAFRMEEGIPYLILNGSDGIKLPINEIMEVRETDAGA